MCRIDSPWADNNGVPVWECSYHHKFMYGLTEKPEKCPRGLEVPTHGPRLAQLEKRRIVLAKTGDRCAYCGTELNIETLHSDHAQSSFNGGKNDTDNLLPSCSVCNVRKNHRNFEDFREWLKLRLLKQTQILIEKFEASSVYFDDGVSAEAVSHIQEIEKLIANTAVTFYIDTLEQVFDSGSHQ